MTRYRTEYEGGSDWCPWAANNASRHLLAPSRHHHGTNRSQSALDGTNAAPTGASRRWMAPTRRQPEPDG
eukprot:9305761-Alexandrium_andersonii.AAC.1